MHLENFAALARRLQGCADLVTISFVDTYARNKKRLQNLGAQEISEEQMRRMAAEIAAIAAENGMRTAACSEPVDLRSCGVDPAKCVDAERLGRIGGNTLRPARDPNQRKHCGCAPSVDIGAYNTCPNGCIYCYANYSPALLKANLARSDADSPMLCDRPSEEDRIVQRKAQSLWDGQLQMRFE